MGQENAPNRPRRWHLLVAGIVALIVGVLAIPTVGAMRASAGNAPRPATAAPVTTAPAETTTTAPEPTTTTTPRHEPTTSAPPAAEAPAPRKLQQGVRGHDVRLLQERLAELHYDLGATDGIFGAGTRHAVIAFQKVNGLQRDGIVGAQTRAALRNPVIPTPRQPRQGTYVEADLTKQVLYFFEGTQVTRIIPVSSANGETYETQGGDTAVAHTPRGQFEIQRKIDGWRESYLGELWRPAYFTGGYAIHGAHSVPPYPASHGCIRVPIEAMNRIYNDLPVGLPLLVY